MHRLKSVNTYHELKPSAPQANPNNSVSHNLICTITQVLSSPAASISSCKWGASTVQQQPCLRSHTHALSPRRLEVCGLNTTKGPSRWLSMQEEGLRLHKHKHSANEGLAPIAPLPAGKRNTCPVLFLEYFYQTTLRMDCTGDKLQMFDLMILKWVRCKMLLYTFFADILCIKYDSELFIILLRNELYLIPHSSSPTKKVQH